MALPSVVSRGRSRRGATAPPRSAPHALIETTAKFIPAESGPPCESTEAVLERKRWQRRYVRCLLVTDTLVVVGAVWLAHHLRFGDTLTAAGFESRYVTAYSIFIAVLWLLMLSAFRTRSPKVVGAGLEEYRRVGVVSFATFSALAIAELVVKLEMSRGYLALAIPAGTLGLVFSRWIVRTHVAGRRTGGGYRTAVLAIGERDDVKQLADELAGEPADGYDVVAVCITGYGPPRAESFEVAGREVPIVGGETHAMEAIRACGADTVALAGTGQFGVRGLRKFIWELEPMGVDLMVSPGLIDIALSRLMMRPVSGIPLLQVEKPQYRGTKRFQKRAFDFCFAMTALTVSLPVLLLAAIAIKATSTGPVLYRSERIGRDGQPFSMLKFRTMVLDADRHLDNLLPNNDCDGPLFKLREDPRVTPVGRVLRRFSIDELPQFINVIRREMSVVGPRPPLRREVDCYDCDVVRRLLVKPGITGLWQVSGRSDLSWERSVRLDLSYVDNWSMVGDIVIIAKTVRAVLARKGAY